MANISNANQELMQQRSEQLTQISETILSLEPSQSSNQSNQEKFEDLNNVLEGMYDEIDKLVKKKSMDPATELIVEQANSIIREIREFMTHDPYIEKLNTFVPAGDLPEVRDVLLALRLARQRMEYFSNKLNQEKQKMDTLLLEAKVIKVALELFQQKYSDDDDYYNRTIKIKTEDIEKLIEIAVPDGWRTYKSPDHIFNFERLDYIEIDNYFRLS